MSAADRRKIREEEKKRKKRLLRAFREDELAKIWNRIMDEVGPCNEDDQEVDCEPIERRNRLPEFECGELDEDYPNRAETMRNIFECD